MASQRVSGRSKSQPVVQEGGEAQTPPFFIVGIGASAGGLEAFTQLFRSLPLDTGMAFVLIQHLAPNHESLLTDLISRETQMRVSEASQGGVIEPNQVYVIPPNRKMTFSKGHLQLSPRENTHGRHHPVDSFFQSLAVQGSSAIGVVLSGGDGDGAIGLKAIKAAGGITFAQDIASSQFGGMPQSAANTGQVDFVLPPQKIAEELVRISRHVQTTPLTSTGSELDSIPDQPEESDQDFLNQIFMLLQTATGVDFTDYKHATLERRMQRRMLIHSLEGLENYVTYLQDNPSELKELYQDLLINVTSFFRDPEAFQALKEQVFPKITQHHSPESNIRIWVPGCATGEEVYSIAICLLEFLDDLIPKPSIQIFATDLNDASIEIARSGIYKLSAMEDVSPERLRRFFVRVEGGYQINKTVRELCVFAKQNLTCDPPFSHLDLISCRNVLIYLGAVLQKRLIPSFHYGLKPTGFLMLGTSETTGGFTDLFTPIDKKNKIYAKKLTATRLNLDFAKSRYPANSNNPARAITNEVSIELSLQQTADQIVWDRYNPAGVVINSDLEILQFRGDTRAYLGLPPGKPSFNLLKMARAGLALELRTAIRQAKKQDIVVKKENLQVEGLELSTVVSIEVIPIQIATAEDRYFLVLFESNVLPDRPPLEDLAVTPVLSQQVGQTIAEQDNIRLKQELAATKAHLQMMIEEQESTNQDFRAVTEEILSSNEEFQSTNEELETAKEEIQAANEELNTINDELRSLNLETDQLNDDLLNVLSSVTLPILILGTDLRIRRFTSMAEQMFNLIPGDVGRSISDIRHNLNLTNLEQLISQVIDTLDIQRQEVQDQEGHWYDLLIRPYRTRENQVVGVVIALVDIDALKRSAQQLQESRDYAAAIVETVWEPLLVLDDSLRVVTANRSFYEMFQVTSAQTENLLIFDLGHTQWDIPELRSQLEATVAQNAPFQGFKVQREFDQIGNKTMLLNARQISGSGDHCLILLAIEDITQREQLEVERANLLAQEQAANRAKDVFLSILSHELRNPLNAMLGWSRLLRGGKLSQDQTQRAVEIIERSATIQTRLIEDLLDISRVTTGKLSLNPHRMNLVPVIKAAIATVSLAAEAKNIQIESRLDPSPQPMLGDAARLQQVMWNLLSNAIKFTPMGGRVEVRLSSVTKSVTQSGAEDSSPVPISFAQIQVSDNGQGISADFLPYVFDRFIQADSTHTRSQGGLGLGLTIVRHLVELHGGTISVESQEGQGTVFTIRLPLSIDPETTKLTPDTELIESPARIQFGDAPTLAGLDVLVVDDEADVRTLMTTVLEQYGAAVTTVNSVNAALQALSITPGKYDVLLSDIGMPEQDGLALIRQVRSLSVEAGGQIPAAALTAYVGVEEQRIALSAGFQMHIAKPVDPAQVALAIATLVGRT